MPDNSKQLHILGRAVWPKLNEPDAFKEGDTPYFKVDVQISPEDAAPLIKKLEAAYEDGYAYHLHKEGKARLKKAPMRPWFDEEDKKTGELTGQMIFRCKKKAEDKNGNPRKLLLIDADCQPMKEKVGGGSLIDVCVEPYVWHVSSQGVGITLQMVGVQVLELQEGGGGSSGPVTAASCGFTKEEGFVTAAAAMSDAGGGVIDNDEPEDGDDF